MINTAAGHREAINMLLSHILRKFGRTQSEISVPAWLKPNGNVNFGMK